MAEYSLGPTNWISMGKLQFVPLTPDAVKGKMSGCGAGATSLRHLNDGPVGR